MRLAAPTCLAIALLLTFWSPSRAEFRHFSSRLIDAGGNEGTLACALGRDGGPFVVAGLSVQGELGGTTVGPGPVIIKFDAAGNLLWARNLLVSYSGVWPPAFSQMAATESGGVVLIGWFDGAVDFGAGSMTSNGADVFLVKLNAAGALLWQRRYGENQTQYGLRVAVDRDDNILVGGDNFSTIDFGGGAITSHGASDAFVAKLTTDGEHIWSHGYGENGVQGVMAIGAGSDNRVAVAFRFDSGNLNVGDGYTANRGQSDIQILVLNPDGSNLWSRYAGTPGNEQVLDLSLDPDNNLMLCGSMNRPLDLGGGVLTPLPTAVAEGFVASYDAGGAHRWSYVIADSVRSHTYSIDTDAFGDCFVVGRSEGTIDFANDRVPPSLGGLLLAFDPNGLPICARGASDVTLFVHVDRELDRVDLCGTLRAPADLGGGVLEPNGSDVVLVSLGLYRSPRVTITKFNARARDGDIKVVWNIASDEALATYAVTRRVDGSPDAEWIFSAPARNGDSSFVDDAPEPGHRYTYRLVVTTELGDDVFSDPASIDLPSAVTALEQNAPNPFNPLTTFRYSLAAPAHVRISIYDISGALVATLDQGTQPAGKHEATWGGHNNEGSFVGSGVYFYRLEGAGDMLARKMILLK